MTEIELIEEIASDTGGYSKAVVHRVIDSFKEVVRKTLKTGEPVVLPGFGTFYVFTMKKTPLFGKPQGKGTWTKVKFHESRRRPLGKVRRSFR